MSQIRVVLADDHPVVLQGIKMLLDSVGGFDVVGLAKNGLEVVELVEKVQPEVLMVDLMMPGLPGLEVVRQIKHRCPHVRIVVFSMHADESYVLQALKNGADGYVLKGCDPQVVEEALRSVAEGRRFLSSGISDYAINSLIEKAQHSTNGAYDTLSAREREVMQLAAEGNSNADIGGKLFISPRTVEVHRASLMRKLGLKSQTDLVRYALGKGLIPLAV